MSSAVADPPLPAVVERAVLDRLQERPFIDRVNPRTLELVRKSRFTGLNDYEAAMALELAAYYDLDPFAGEIWATKGQARNGREGQLLIMVGRDGLRKVVMRNGLSMDGDVVRKKDSFRVVRAADRTRTVEHQWEGDAETRGPIVGAWAEVWDAAGNQRGFFYAPMKEYRPTSEPKLQYSPWGSQESVMILAAAERQAARQATPLSGLLVEGEMDLNEERALAGAAEADDVALQAVIDSVDAPEGLRDRLYEAVSEGNRLAPNSYSAMKVQLLVAGKDPEALEREVEEMERLNAEHRERAARQEAEPQHFEGTVTDAVVVPDEAELTEEERAAKIEGLRNTVADLEAALEDPDTPDKEKMQDQLNEAELALRELTGEE